MTIERAVLTAHAEARLLKADQRRPEAPRGVAVPLDRVREVPISVVVVWAPIVERHARGEQEILESEAHGAAEVLDEARVEAPRLIFPDVERAREPQRSERRREPRAGQAPHVMCRWRPVERRGDADIEDADARIARRRLVLVDEVEAARERRIFAIFAIPLEEVRRRRRVVEQQELAGFRLAIVEDHERIVEYVARPDRPKVRVGRRIVAAVDARIRAHERLLIEHVRRDLKLAEQQRDAAERAQLVAAAALFERPARDREGRVGSAVGDQALHRALHVAGDVRAVERELGFGGERVHERYLLHERVVAAAEVARARARLLRADVLVADALWRREPSRRRRPPICVPACSGPARRSLRCFAA